MHGNVWERCEDRWDASAYRRRWDGITAAETFQLNDRIWETRPTIRFGSCGVVRGSTRPSGAERRFASRGWAGVSSWSFGYAGLSGSQSDKPSKVVAANGESVRRGTRSERRAGKRRRRKLNFSSNTRLRIKVAGTIREPRSLPISARFFSRPGDFAAASFSAASSFFAAAPF